MGRKVVLVERYFTRVMEMGIRTPRDMRKERVRVSRRRWRMRDLRS
jgi:hypothetical protein